MKAAGLVLFAAHLLGGLPPLHAADRAAEAQPLAWLKSGNYAALDQYYSGQQRDYEAGRESDQDLYRNFRELYEDSVDNAAYFDRWVAAYPQSYAALLARGTYEYRMAWAARGEKYLRDTPAPQIDSMLNWLRRARPDLTASLVLTAKPYLSALYLLNVSMLQGTAADRQHWYALGTTLDPGNTLVRYRYMFSLRPRWGGSYQQMETFLGECQQQHLPPALLARLEMLIHADRAEEAMSAADNARTFDEWAQVLRLADAAGESPSTEALIGYTRAAQDLNRRADAERGIELLADRKPTDTWSLARLGWIYARANRDADAWPLLLKAAEQNDSWAQFVVGREMYHGDPAVHMAPDPVGGLAWIRRSADQCYPEAERFLTDHGEKPAGGCRRRSLARGWETVLPAAAGPVVVSLVSLILAARRRQQRASPVAGQLRHPASTLIVGLLGFVLFLVLAVLSVVFDSGTGSALVTGGFLGFAALSLLMVAAYYRTGFELTADGVSYGRLFGARGTIRWRDVTQLTYSRTMKWFRIESSSGEVARVSIALVGLPEFARTVLAQVPSYAIAESAQAMLQQTANGELTRLA